MHVTVRAVAAAVLLFVGAGLALLGVLIHYGSLSVYGDVTGSPGEAFIWGLTAGPSRMALLVVAVFVVLAFMLSNRPWMRWSAVAVPVLMLAGMFAVTPLALGQRLEKQYISNPQCLTSEHDGPMAGSDRRAQQVFDSISHIGRFNGGGMSGAGGCTRWFVVPDGVDVLQHYRSVLPGAGWQIVEDDGLHLRAHRKDSAFDVTTCPGGGVVWAGNVTDPSYGRGTTVAANTEVCPHDL
ncbi:hypothetical protein ACFYLX_14955 [Pseudarthrobacter enclensis]|uniref:hypothetical protein n=1 Tax=Pseudarthrobacter enclensis TaxID=993070 RepID=UPI00368B0DAF